MSILSKIFTDGFRQDEARRVSGLQAETAGLLAWDDVADLLERRCFEGPGSYAIATALNLEPGLSRVCLLRDAKQVTRWPVRTDLAAFASELSGSTLRIEAAEEIHPPLRPLAEELTAAAPDCYINIYAAWGTRPGLALHYDYTHILVLQLQGEKAWRVYRPTKEPVVRGPDSSAYKKSVQDAEAGLGGDPGALQLIYDGLWWEGVLKPGDALYMPPGWFHSAKPLGGPTLQLSCAFGALPALGPPSTRIALPDMLRSP